MNSPWRKQPAGNVFGELGARKKTYLKGPHYKAAIRNPAWCIVKGAVSAPSNPKTFKELYVDQFKPGKLLKNVTIRLGGENFGLVIEVDCEIQCNTLSEFTQVEKAFCAPGKKFSVEFGYHRPWGDGYSGSNNIKGLRVAKFSMDATAEGTWIVKFSGVAPGVALRDIQLGVTPLRAGKISYIAGSKKYKVNNIQEMIVWHAQVNGSRSIDDAADGEVIKPDVGGAMVIYEPDHLPKDYAENIINLFSTRSSNETSATKNILYMTLEYLVELVNKELLPSMKDIVGEDAADFSKLKIKFDSTLSKSYVDYNIRSAYPTKVLMLGGKATWGTHGNYKNNGGKGKNFEKCTNLSILNCYKGPTAGRSEVDFKKILIEKSIVFSCMQEAYAEPEKSNDVGAKETSEGTITLKTFFNQLFKAISDATGGAIKLRLSLHPDCSGTNNESLLSELYIFDENNGKTNSVNCYIFNPIDGDGSTRSCNVQSNVGSKEYQGDMFSKAKKSSDPVNTAQGKTRKGNSPAWYKAVGATNEIIYNPGSLGDDVFNDIHMKSLQDAMNTIRLDASDAATFDMSIYPGLSIDIEIDGIWGFWPGNAIMTTQLPSKYWTNNTYFMVTSVTHTLDGAGSDWSTKLSGPLTFCKKLVPIT
jgi:hypothetical protein